MVQTLFCSCLQHPGLLPLAVCSNTLMENFITVLSHIGTYKIKAAHDEQILWEIKVYLARYIEEFVLLCGIALFSVKS